MAHFFLFFIYSYSPAPAGHFPEELAMTAPSGLMSWDDVRVRYEYYKSRGYLRDLDLEVRVPPKCIFFLISIFFCDFLGLHKMGGVVVQIPRMVKTGKVL